MTAAAVTILFRRLKMPLILGYIVAGFLISPHFPLFFGVEDQASLDNWSEIGVIIILFHIGLEFDLHRLSQIGSTALVSTAVKMSGVMACGYGFGMVMGLSHMDSIFLGAMLSISSTVVIQKSFEEIDLSGEKFPTLVMGGLVMEDVFSIFMMVILSTLAVSKDVNGLGLAQNLGLMIVYLVIWIVLGIYILPTFLNRVMDVMSDEMLTLLSLGFCFSMALLAELLGFSTELGAFIAGSLFAGTVHVERVERITKGVKDMFGAVFFLSVGMLVNPDIIVSHWKAIVPIAILAVIVKLIFATIGVVMSGQDIETAIKCGISLAPIGEFSFIIANLGISLGVMDEYLYPVIVAASVLTIIVTPSFIKNSGRAADRIMNIMPDGLLELIDDYTSDDQDEEERDQEWGIVIKTFFRKTIIYGGLMLVAAIAGVRLVAPFLTGHIPHEFVALITTGLIYIVIAIFVVPYLDFHSVNFTHLWLRSRANRPPLVMLIAIKILVVALIAFIPIARLFNFHHLLPIAVVLIALVLFSRTDLIQRQYLYIESRFLMNLNEKVLEEEIAEEMNVSGEKQKEKSHHWLDEEYCISAFYVPDDFRYKGIPLKGLGWGRDLDIYVVKIKRAGKVHLMPSGQFELRSGDKVYIVGEAASIDRFYNDIAVGRRKPVRTLKNFLDIDYPDAENALACIAIRVQGIEPYAGMKISESRILDKSHCMILGIRRNGITTRMPDSAMVIEKGDVLWVIGSNNNVGQLVALSIEEEHHRENQRRQELRERREGRAKKP